MCWRGHGPEQHYLGSDGNMKCRRCHLLRIRNSRHPEYPVEYRPLFSLKIREYQRIRNRYGWNDLTVALMVGMSESGIHDYQRGTKGGKRRQVRATRARAAAIAQAMRCDFSQLWSQI
jgi:hypothetical protein